MKYRVLRFVRIPEHEHNDGAPHWARFTNVLSVSVVGPYTVIKHVTDNSPTETWMKSDDIIRIEQLAD